jgi:choline dehydrogenase-like flavoprotein
VAFQSETKKYRLEEEIDVVVIGTGAGGAPVLAHLASAGLKVIALEAGPWWKDPSEDFATDEINSRKLYWLGERLSAGDTPTAFGANNSGTGVGGSTLHWGAYVPRADPRDLNIQSEFGVGEDWPLDYAALKPYYEDVERFIGVSGPATYPWDADRSYPLGPLPLNAPAQAMQIGCKRLGIRTSEAPIAALSRDYSQAEYGHRHACVNRGYCHQGCRNGAKASMDVTYLPMALSAGAEIRPECFVHGFDRDTQGKITAVIYRHKGQDFRQRCKAVFLCAGAIETPRLLLHTELANSSGQVGHNFMAHVATQVWGTFPDEMRPHKGFPASLITEDMIRRVDADFVGGYITQSLGIVPITWAMQVARGRGLWGQSLVDYLDQYNYVAGIGINGDCLPSPDNFLELSSEVDETGLARPLIHFSYGENEKRMSAHAEAWMSEAWKAAGATDIWTFQRSAHTIGTCRMGTDPSRSVVDPNCRSHDIANLWIVDNSVFPSALPANPALTIMALALRSADAYLRARSY